LILPGRVRGRFASALGIAGPDGAPRIGGRRQKEMAAQSGHSPLSLAHAATPETLRMKAWCPCLGLTVTVAGPIYPNTRYP
jgi:hypothetical protein